MPKPSDHPGMGVGYGKAPDMRFGCGIVAQEIFHAALDTVLPRPSEV
jgi:hypothetical protein